MTNDEALWKIGLFEFNPVRRQLRRIGQEEWKRLRNKDADVLIFLIDNYARRYDNEALVDTVWTEKFVEDDPLYQSIHNLRNKFGGERDSYIDSRPYRLLVKPERIIDIKAAALNSTEPEASRSKTRSDTRRQEPGPDADSTPNYLLKSLHQIPRAPRDLTGRSEHGSK